LDDQQRQQLDQMQQGVFNPMMNPMMMQMMMNPMNSMNPMMTGGGLSPMMTGGGMGGMGGMNPMMTGMNPMMSGFGGMGGGYGPQHMFAAQQAAQAYQQAMMAFSVAGSQVGGPTGAGGNGGNGAEGGALPSQGGNINSMNTGTSGMGMLNPAMTGMGFDPRMSMFGMNTMGMGMPGMGMHPMGMGGGLGAQMTGMSNFDAMASSAPGFTNAGGGGGMGVGMGGNASPNANEHGGGGLGSLGLQPPMQRSQFSSRTSSPAGRGSPRGFGPNGDHLQQHYDRGRPSRPATPK
jgi:CCR4-NOT transcriptional complex subunit CAF120